MITVKTIKTANADMTAPPHTKISPNPTKGETTPPNKNPAAPITAEAVPEYVRSASIAAAVAAVNDNPREKHKTNSRASYTATGIPAGIKTASAKQHGTTPAQLAVRHDKSDLNLTETPAPIPIATAFAAKKKLKARGLNP